MSKLSTSDKFFDFSDYGRPFAILLATALKNTRFTPIHVTLMFGISGLLAIDCIINAHYFCAAFFIILKSVIDAADGELARIKNTPSYTGRYLDSVFDIILNFLFFMAIWYVTQAELFYALLAFICVQLQGTLYNYYYVIKRNSSVGGDTTSKIFESKSPGAFTGENQRAVNILFTIFSVLYGLFDKAVYWLDKTASETTNLPKWFMTLVSLYGLGFQLLIMAVMLAAGMVVYIIPFFIIYSVLAFVFIGIRKNL